MFSSRELVKVGVWREGIQNRWDVRELIWIGGGLNSKLSAHTRSEASMETRCYKV